MALTKDEEQELAMLNAMAGESEHLTKAEQEELNALNSLAEAPIATYNPMQGLEDTARAAAQGLTFGHLPQIQGALKSGSVSGPEYEQEKMAVRKSLAEGHRRNPQLTFAGEAIGSVIPLPAAGLATGIKVTGAAKSALLNAILGAAQNPGGDVDDPESLKKRAWGAGLGGSIGAFLGKLQTATGPAAERQAFKALGPTKTDYRNARYNNRVEGIGRDVLDEDIIGNIPRSKEVLYERTKKAKDAIGAEKADIINIIDEEAGPMANIDFKDIEKKFVDRVQMNPDYPEALDRLHRAKKFAGSIGAAHRPGSQMSLKDADSLKIDTGRLVKWLRQNRQTTDPEKQLFNKELYHLLNEAVDDKASGILSHTVLKNDILRDRFFKTKSMYGHLKDAKTILDNKINSEEARRALSPSDYGVGLSSVMGATIMGNTPMNSILIGAGLGASNKLMRTYGRQMTAKQLDNASRVLNYSPIYNSMIAAPPGIYGTYNRSNDPSMSSWGLLKTTTKGD